mgnify:CR=1 FL=1
MLFFCASLLIHPTLKSNQTVSTYHKIAISPLYHHHPLLSSFFGISSDHIPSYPQSYPIQSHTKNVSIRHHYAFRHPLHTHPHYYHDRHNHHHHLHSQSVEQTPRSHLHPIHNKSMEILSERHSVTSSSVHLTPVVSVHLSESDQSACA